MDLAEYMKGGLGLEDMTEKERELAEVFAEVIGIDTGLLGPNSDFFALGGDSISAILLVQQAKEIGLSFSTKDVFSKRTIKRLATFGAQNISEVVLLPIVVRYIYFLLLSLHLFPLL